MNNVFFNSTDGKMVQVQVSELNMLCVCILHPHVYSWRAAFMSCRQNGKKIEEPIVTPDLNRADFIIVPNYSCSLTELNQ